MENNKINYVFQWDESNKFIADNTEFKEQLTTFFDSIGNIDGNKTKAEKIQLTIDELNQELKEIQEQINNWTEWLKVQKNTLMEILQAVDNAPKEIIWYLNTYFTTTSKKGIEKDGPNYELAGEDENI